jgi:preprotein translocase subunit SecD
MVYLDPDVVLGSRDVEYVQDGGCSGGACYVSFRFTANGARRMGRVSTSHIGRYLAIVVDGRVVTFAYITGPMTDGLQETFGSRREAEQLLSEVTKPSKGGDGPGKGGSD